MKDSVVKSRSDAITNLFGAGYRFSIIAVYIHNRALYRYYRILCGAL